MPDAIAVDCLNHPGTKAVGRCAGCGKPFCRECRVEHVAADKEYCSRDCKVGARALQRGDGLTTDVELLEGLHAPIRAGWRLWARSMKVVAIQTAPIAALLAGIQSIASRDGFVEFGRDVSELASYIVGAFGIALVQVTATQDYAGMGIGNPYLRTARRFLPWLITFVVAWGLIVGGYFVFVVPGIYLSLRLFWAEEFALLHGANPIEALRESWDLTRDAAGTVFVFQLRAGLALYGTLAMIGLPVWVAMYVWEMTGLVLPKPVEDALLFWVLFIGYAGWHAPEVAYLYGMRAERSTSFADASRTLDL